MDIELCAEDRAAYIYENVIMAVGYMIYCPNGYCELWVIKLALQMQDLGRSHCHRVYNYILPLKSLKIESSLRI